MKPAAVWFCADCAAGDAGLGDAAHPELWRPTRHGRAGDSQGQQPGRFSECPPVSVHHRGWEKEGTGYLHTRLKMLFTLKRNSTDFLHSENRGCRLGKLDSLVLLVAGINY